MSAQKAASGEEDFSEINLIEYDAQIESAVSLGSTILYSARWPQGKILDLAVEGCYQTFLNSQNSSFEEDLLSAMKIQKDPEGFLKNPLESLFKQPTSSLVLNFNKKEDKQALFSKIDAFLGTSCSQFARDNITALFEELFMNSIYDAPAEAAKSGVSIQSPSCQMFIGIDDSKVTITCVDGYGSLTSKKMIKRISDIEKNGTKDIINLGQRAGGAGIGCSLMYNNSSSIVIVVKSGLATSVSCTVPLKMSQRKFLSLGKNLQIINISPHGGNNGT